MQIGGLRKVSLIDYPGRVSAVIFTQGCNFRCPYCHNPELVDPKRYGPCLVAAEVLDFLSTRQGKLEAVTITGGEPTLQSGLEPFLLEIRNMGYLIKLDTNGSMPNVLDRLIRNSMVDYVAMDIKGPLEKYKTIVAAAVETRKIEESIQLITKSNIDHEFRTTVVRSQLEPADLLRITKLLENAKLYILQNFVASKTLNKEFISEASYSKEELSVILKNHEGQNFPIILR